MKPLCLAAVLILAGTPPAVCADSPGSAQQPGSASVRQGTKDDAPRAKQGARGTARSLRESIRSGAANLKRDLAVARCNDGRYSYTRHHTCDRHGGVQQRYR